MQPAQPSFEPSNDPHQDIVIAGLQRPAYAPWLLLILVVGGAGYGAHWGLKERQRLLGELQKSAATEKARQELEQRTSALEAEKLALLGEREALQKDVVAKEGQLAELKDTHDKIQEKMKDEIAKGEIELSQSGGRLRVDMIDKILFDSGDARISRRGEGVLARVGAVLGNVPDRQIQVLGHTDDQPISTKLKAQFPTNWELSASRALNVVRFLEEKAKVPAERLVASGHGEHQPIASNKSAAGRARNRRIEILLTPELDPQRVSQRKLDQATRAVADARGKQATAPKR
jgi:chemotaxis protein MotB